MWSSSLNVESLSWEATKMHQAILDGGLCFWSLFGVYTWNALQLFWMVWTRSVEFGWLLVELLVLGIIGLHSHSLGKSRHAPVNFWAICWNLIRQILLNLINTHIKSLTLHQLHLKSWKIHLTCLSSASYKFHWFFVRIKACNPPSIVDEDFIFNRTMLAMKLGFFNSH